MAGSVIHVALEDDRMDEMRKLKVIVLEEYIDAVVRSLGQAGVVQFIDMREKLDEWKGVLVSHSVPTGTLQNAPIFFRKSKLQLKTCT